MAKKAKAAKVVVPPSVDKPAPKSKRALETTSATAKKKAAVKAPAVKKKAAAKASAAKAEATAARSRVKQLELQLKAERKLNQKLRRALEQIQGVVTSSLR